tara:strand:+ start:853 stop:1137 length:285 start_codon:yes stop_codon:yes gene_type:complete
MFFWTIQQIIISILIISTIHYLYDFFKENLTIPKVKDLVNKPEKKYKEIYSSINTNKVLTNEKKNINKKDMKNELKQYLSNLSQKNDEPASYSF